MQKGKQYTINYWDGTWCNLTGKYLGVTVDGDSLFEDKDGIHVVGDYRIASADKFTVNELINLLNTFDSNSIVEIYLDNKDGISLETRGSNLFVKEEGNIVQISGKCFTTEY